MVELIAEVSSNHGGDLDLAKEFIHRYAEAGANWVKFQTTRVRHLRLDDPQYQWFKRAELSDEAHDELKAECERAGVKFLTTVYHADDVPWLVSLGLEGIKIGSGEAGEERLASAILHKLSGSIFISTGLIKAWSTAVWQTVIAERWSPRKVDPSIQARIQDIHFLGCVTRYPAPRGVVVALIDSNEGGMTTGPICHTDGWSDHSIGIEECQVAIVLGATIIEKHVSLPHQARPVQPWEATVEEFKALRQFADENPQRFIGRWQS